MCPCCRNENLSNTLYRVSVPHSRCFKNMAAERPRATHSETPSQFLAMLCPGTFSTPFLLGTPWIDLILECFKQLSSSFLCRVGGSQGVEVDFSLLMWFFAPLNLFLGYLRVLNISAVHMRIKPKLRALLQLFWWKWRPGLLTRAGVHLGLSWIFVQVVFQQGILQAGKSVLDSRMFEESEVWTPNHKYSQQNPDLRITWSQPWGRAATTRLLKCHLQLLSFGWSLLNSSQKILKPR